ncbi:Microsomal dipeptidase [Klebsiella pneumoniae]|uniref:Microsomal dipeptidase n=1 Tax=Klebsiella pneumoniae TaxID=573 RepID=A0A4P0Y975_KLEPN|nr:Microsomal dipeptidase [Klebsiella pneumoniae]
MALGSDFDGITLPDELGDVAGLPRLINMLRASGYDHWCWISCCGVTGYGY